MGHPAQPLEQFSRARVPVFRESLVDRDHLLIELGGPRLVTHVHRCLSHHREKESFLSGPVLLPGDTRRHLELLQRRAVVPLVPQHVAQPLVGILELCLKSELLVDGQRLFPARPCALAISLAGELVALLA